MEITGYLHPAYAHSLSDVGTPRLLPSSGAWILSREIAAAPYRDGMGCYPLFCCPDWSRLPEDLENLSGLLSLTIVADPFGDYDLALLRTCFPDVVFLFKRHFVTDLSTGPDAFVSPHHRRNARLALRTVTVTHSDAPWHYAQEWASLYARLISRHEIRGIAAFSDASLRGQLEVPGLLLFRAEVAGDAAGMILWMVQNGIAYYHLGAYSEAGYRERASFALFWKALEFFRASGVRWLCLGAGAGIREEEMDGLTRFKRGWSTGDKPAYLCGRIFDARAYESLSSRRGTTGHAYFPAYREGEFG